MALGTEASVLVQEKGLPGGGVGTARGEPASDRGEALAGCQLSWLGGELLA